MVPLLLALAHAEPTIYTASAPEGEAQLRTWLASEPTVSMTIDTGALVVSCPLAARCDENAPYWAVHSRDVYISFDPAVLSDQSLASLQENLSYINIRQRIPLGGEWEAGLSRPYRVEDGGVTVEGYDGGRLRVRITQPTSALSSMLYVPRCVESNLRKLPEGCDAYLTNAEIPTQIVIDLPVTFAPRDCTGDNTEGCGRLP